MKIRATLELVDDYLQVFLFGLMCIGLALASLFLWRGLIDGGEWVAVCGILFGSNTIGSGLTHFGRGKPAPAPPDNGYQRPL